MDNSIEKLYQKERLFKILENNLSEDEIENSYVQNLKHKLEHQQNEELYTPIIGVQGAGKSSFLNALLGESILPAAEEETTCIPIEIRHGQPEIKVHLKNGNRVNLEVASNIQDFVHNKHNPGNKKEVQKIEVFLEHELLGEDIVLIDLPGVGSLTTSNVQVIRDYIEKVSVAIVLVRSTPPITKSEMSFLKSLIPKLIKVWFVQNRWEDESDEEVFDGQRHNLSLLQTIDSDAELYVIQVKNALTGTLIHDDTLIRESGLKDFYELLIQDIMNRQEMLEEEQKRLESSATNVAIDTTLQQLQSLKKQKQFVIDEKMKAEQFFSETSNDKNTVFKEVLEVIKREEKHISYALVAKAQRLRTELTNRMKTLVEKNVLDGAFLEKGFEDKQQEIANEYADFYTKQLNNLHSMLEELLGNVEFQTTRASMNHFEKLNSKSKIKVEKVFPTVASLIGGIGTILLFTNPVGLTAILTGGVVGMVGSFLGSTAKESIQEKRQQRVMEKLDPVIDKFITELHSYFERNFKETALKISISIQKYQKMQFDYLSHDLKKVKEECEENEISINKKMKSLDEDLHFLEQLKRI